MTTTPKPNGGPAFPIGAMSVGDGDTVAFSNGMSLRDWFAGQAIRSDLQLLATNANDYQARAHARWAYMVADAMIAAREAGQ